MDVLAVLGLGVNEGRGIWYITAVGDKDGITSVVGECVASATNIDSVSRLMTDVSSALGLRDAPCCELPVVSGVVSAVADAVAVATCNWLTSMCVGAAVDSGFVIEAVALLGGDAPDEGVAIWPPLSSMATGIPHAHSAAMKSASNAAHLRDPKLAH